MYMYNHYAFNLTAEEMIACTTGNHLKRIVSMNEQYNRKHGEKPGKWIFAHGKDADVKLYEKVNAYHEGRAV